MNRRHYSRSTRVPLPVLLGVSLLGWSLFALLSTAQSWVYLAARSDVRPLSQVAGTTFAMMWAWAIFTPFIFLIALRYPLRRPIRVRSVLVHLTLVLLLPLVDALVRQLVYPLFGFDLAPIMAVYLRFFDVSFFAYVAIVGLAHVFDMGVRLQREELQKTRLQAELARAEVLTLKMQLQPHFLFNTLHGIAEMVHEDPAQADRMITRLGDLLRLTMETSGVQEVPLSQELGLLQSYLAIQEVRFGSRLDVKYDVQADVRDAMVPGFLLQPLVENALRHGIADRVEGGHIVVRAWRKDRRLHLTVSDDGRGADGGYAEGFGLRNTRERLLYLYGDGARFTLDATGNGEGTVAAIALPFRTRAKEHGENPPPLTRPEEQAL
jgi:two-component system LytT family sensor kinase